LLAWGMYRSRRRLLPSACANSRFRSNVNLIDGHSRPGITPGATWDKASEGSRSSERQAQTEVLCMVGFLVANECTSKCRASDYFSSLLPNRPRESARCGFTMEELRKLIYGKAKANASRLVERRSLGLSGRSVSYLSFRVHSPLEMARSLTRCSAFRLYTGG
jgi:hypothetical protein